MVVMLLEWVFTSIFLIFVVLALRAALGKRVSAGLRYALWAVVLVRLLVPVQLFTSPLAGTWVVSEADTERNVYTVPAPSANLAEPVISLPETGVTPGAVPNFPDAPTMPDAPEPPAAPDLTRAPAWLGWIWLAGSAAVALVLLVSNLRFYWRLRRERVLLEGADCHLRVYAAVNLPSPCLLGIARPAIYVTPEAAADPDMLRHVLAHEHTHYRHGDHVWSLLRCAALVVHWWNPLVWVSAVLSQRDAELACDEGALKRLGDGERAGYGGTLLALVTAKPRPADLFRCATTMAGDKKSLKERITRIAQAPKRWLWAAVAVVLVTALACACAFGKAAEEPEDGEEDFLPVWAYGVSEMTYARDEGGFGGDFTITFRYDGTFTYYEGGLSSYIGAGTWGRKGDVIRLSDEVLKDSFGVRYFYFRLDSGGLVFQAEDSDRFTYVDVADGERFSWKYSGTPDSSDLSFSLDEDDLVNITGTVLGMTLERGTCWQATGAPAHSLSMPYDPFTDGAKGHITAWWETPPSVSVTTYMMALPSSSSFAGYWNFTVDLSGEEAIVTRMEAQTGLEMPEGAAARMYPETISDEEAIRAARIAAKLLTEAEEYYNSAAQAPSELSPDLNRNGVPEELRVIGVPQGTKLEVWEEGKLLYSEEGYFAHAGYNALFLCTLDGEDYLLRYHPTMYQGYCTYNYQLFSLSKVGMPAVERVVMENNLEFSINIASPMIFGGLYDGSFDPEKITAFVDEINGLLAHSVQIINTDADLLGTFQDAGRLVDDLWWLDTWEPVFTRDPSKSLLDNLRDFQTAMEEQWHAEEPKVFRMNEGEVKGNDAHVLLRYQDKSTQFDARWESEFQPEEAVNPRVLDLNRDGKDEIVFSLVEGEGTGCLVENLYVFDAETLEQYDTDRLNEMIFNSIESTGDEENFYLRGAGMDETIPKSEAQAKNPYAPMADTLWFEDYIRYAIEDGQVFCWLGCDASGSLINYTGYIKVPLQMSTSGAFTCGMVTYVSGLD